MATEIELEQLEDVSHSEAYQVRARPMQQLHATTLQHPSVLMPRLNVACCASCRY